MPVEISIKKVQGRKWMTYVKNLEVSFDPSLFVCCVSVGTVHARVLPLPCSAVWHSG